MPEMRKDNVIVKETRTIDDKGNVLKKETELQSVLQSYPEDIKKEMEKRKKSFKQMLWYFTQKILFFLRDNDYYNNRNIFRFYELNYKIKTDTFWLASPTFHGDKTHLLPFHDQAVKYYEYKNMIIQRRAQYVIIFLTITLLIMTAVEVYFEFIKN